MVSSLTKKDPPRRRAGFTLVELLVAVLILSTLSAVALPLYLSTVKRSAQRTVQENLRTITIAAHAYKARTGTYPPKYTNASKDGTGAPSAFVGADRDLESVPRGPGNVWYEWYVDTGVDAGEFVAKANENGQDLWGSPGVNQLKNYACFNLTEGRYYRDGNGAFPGP